MWYTTYTQFHRTQLGMRHTATDPAVFVSYAAAVELEQFITSRSMTACWLTLLLSYDAK